MEKKSNYRNIPKFIFIADNLRVGGIQRLLLDESYWLIEKDMSITIATLSKSIEFDDIIEIDKNFPLTRELDIRFAGESKFEQIRFVARLVKSYAGPVTIVSHSTSGAFIGRLGSLLSLRNVKVSLYIHQVLTLSDREQRIKRLAQSLFAHNVYVSSMQFKLSWDEHVAKSKIWSLIFRKKINFDRMGVYLPRLMWSGWEKISPCATSVPHLIFMSRVTAWKGMTEFLRICENNISNGLHAIVVTTRNAGEAMLGSGNFVNQNHHLVSESGATTFNWPKGSVHIYPTNYGAETKYPQSIGINVLEFLALGIPSMISKEGFESWPELSESLLVCVCDWKSNTDINNHIEKLELITTEQVEEELQRILPFISIEAHGQNLLSLLSES